MHVPLCVYKYMGICADQRTTLGVILQVLSTLKKKKKKRPCLELSKEAQLAVRELQRCASLHPLSAGIT